MVVLEIDERESRFLFKFNIEQRVFAMMTANLMNNKLHCEGGILYFYLYATLPFMNSNYIALSTLMWRGGLSKTTCMALVLKYTRLKNVAPRKSKTRERYHPTYGKSKKKIIIVLCEKVNIIKHVA